MSADSVKHLRCSLRVTDVCQLLQTSILSHKVDLCRGIILSHLSERKQPIVSFCLVIESLVAHTVFRTSLISKPDIIPSTGELECWGDIWMIHYPAICWVNDPVLEEHCRSRSGHVCDFMFGNNPEQIEDITILRNDWMGFKTKSILKHNEFEWLPCILGFIQNTLDLLLKWFIR